MTSFFNDFETYSDLDITKVGGYRYSTDPSCRALMLAYAFDNGPVEQWVPAEGQKMPRDVKDALRDPDITKRAWNAAFEKNIYRHVLGEKIFEEEWRCTQTMAMTCSLPASLGDAGAVLDIPLDRQKDKEGKKLIKLFCTPQKATKTQLEGRARKPYIRNPNYISHPEEWERFKSYNRQDVVAERGNYRIVRKWDLPDHEWEMWELDQEINRDGVPINMEVVRMAIRYTEHCRATRYARIKKITGVENPRSGPQLLEWLKDNGYRFDDMKKGHVERASKDEELDDDTREVLTLRAEVAKTSPDKFYAIERAAEFINDEWVVRGAFKFAGAQRTWRWSGSLFQPQNLPRPSKELEGKEESVVTNLVRLSPRALDLLYDKPMDMLSTAIRPSIQAPEGWILGGMDLNAIENRVLGYLADDQKILDVFRKDRDPYIDFAGYMFETDYETEWTYYEPEGPEGKHNKDHRTTAKPGVLGCGYMLSAGEQRENEQTGEIEATGLLGYAWEMGIKDFTLEQSELSVDVWRDTYEDTVKYWWEISDAAKDCLRTGKEQFARHISFDRSGPMMRMRLPSGRNLHYVRPRIEETEQVWCDFKLKYLPLHMCKEPNRKKTRIKANITYEGYDKRRQWGRLHTHPGKLTENADQAVSRDLVAEAMKRFRRRVPRSVARIRIHVHDEIVACINIAAAKAMFGSVERVLEILQQCMAEEMPWATEKELPLGAKGSLGRIWIKD